MTNAFNLSETEILGSFQKFVAVSLYSWLVLCRVDGLTVNVGRSFSQKCDCAVETWQCSFALWVVSLKSLASAWCKKYEEGAPFPSCQSFYVIFMIFHGNVIIRYHAKNHGTWVLHGATTFTAKDSSCISTAAEPCWCVDGTSISIHTTCDQLGCYCYRYLQCMVGAPKLPPCFGRPPSGENMEPTKRHGSER